MTVAELIARAPWLDRLTDRVQPPVAADLDRPPSARDGTTGAWLGEPLRASPADVPVGAWTTSLLLDLAGDDGAARAADGALAVAFAAAIPTAAAGVVDSASWHGEPRRVAPTQGALNVVAVGLAGASLLARASGRRRLGRALSVAGFGLVGLSAYLGGELARHDGLREEASRDGG